MVDHTYRMLCQVVIMLPACIVLAQDSSNGNLPTGPVVVVTGCLNSSDQADEYVLTTLDKTKWQIKLGKPVDLVTQVSHLVQVRGVMLTNPAQSAADVTGPPEGEMVATDVRKLDENCPK